MLEKLVRGPLEKKKGPSYYKLKEKEASVAPAKATSMLKLGQLRDRILEFENMYLPPRPPSC